MRYDTYNIVQERRFPRVCASCVTIILRVYHHRHDDTDRCRDDTDSKVSRRRLSHPVQ